MMNSESEMKSIRQTIFVALVSCIFLVNPRGFSQQSEAKTKSAAVAVLLGLDPIPGDALFYAGKPVQGSINLGIGAGGALLSEIERHKKHSFLQTIQPTFAVAPDSAFVGANFNY
jgi:hypothetical protein